MIKSWSVFFSNSHFWIYGISLFFALSLGALLKLLFRKRNTGRSAILLLSMALGMFGVGIILSPGFYLPAVTDYLLPSALVFIAAGFLFSYFPGLIIPPVALLTALLYGGIFLVGGNIPGIPVQNQEIKILVLRLDETGAAAIELRTPEKSRVLRFAGDKIRLKGTLYTVNPLIPYPEKRWIFLDKLLEEGELQNEYSLTQEENSSHLIEKISSMLFGFKILYRSEIESPSVALHLMKSYRVTADAEKISVSPLSFTVESTDIGE